MKVCFDQFRFDPRTLLLERDGRPVDLQPQPARVLAMLTGRPGEVLGREELQNAVWGDAFVDREHGLNFAIRQIRVALGDSATAPRFIETLPRRGYRFLAPVAQEAVPRASERWLRKVLRRGEERAGRRPGLLAPPNTVSWPAAWKSVAASAVLWIMPVAWHAVVPCGSPQAARLAALYNAADHRATLAIHAALGGRCPYQMARNLLPAKSSPGAQR